MGFDPPFIYDRPSTYSLNAPTDKGFNPKAATQASWAPPSPRPKKDGPLIEFNKHPDSYLVVPYGNLNVKPMNPNTKDKVKTWRRVQLFLRMCELLGALGMLFCVIAITKTTTGTGWIIRVAPAVSVVHTIYAVYHLGRSATDRTPASTASYMVFATLIDTGLVPFFVFSALASHSDYTTNAYGWSTLFSTTEMSYKIIYGFFLVCVVEGAFMILSLMVGIYLATVFRKIVKLPPDMNPLEPNLTARPHHKRNKSEVVSEKHLSGSTVGSNRPMSGQADPTIAGSRRIPFLHTRTDSADSITLYGNNSARNSKVALEEKEEFQYRRSQLSTEVDGLSRPTSAVNPPTDSARSSGPGQQYRNKTPTWLSYLDYEGVPRNVSGNAAEILNAEVQAPPPIPQQSPRRTAPESIITKSKNWFGKSVKVGQLQPSAALPSISPNLTPQPLYQAKKRSREPLGMNPPTPRQQVIHDENDAYYPEQNSKDRMLDAPSRNVLHDAELNTVSRPKQSSRTSSFIGSGGKARYFGSLRSSISSLNTIDNQHAAVQDHNDDNDDDSVSNYSRTHTMSSVDSHIEVYGVDDYDDDDDSETILHGYTGGQTGENSTSSAPELKWNGSTRQVSNSTAHDLQSGYAGLGAEFGRGMGRRREVSGKVVEEGRSPGMSTSAQKKQQQPPVSSTGAQEKKAGAAGWARFKGL